MIIWTKRWTILYLSLSLSLSHTVVWSELICFKWDYLPSFSLSLSFSYWYLLMINIDWCYFFYLIISIQFFIDSQSIESTTFIVGQCHIYHLTLQSYTCVHIWILIHFLFHHEKCIVGIITQSHLRQSPSFLLSFCFCICVYDGMHSFDDWMMPKTDGYGVYSLFKQNLALRGPMMLANNGWQLSFTSSRLNRPQKKPANDR